MDFPAESPTPNPRDLSAAVNVTSEAKIDRAIAALVADWERQEGILPRSQFERLVLKRSLSAEEIASVRRGLARLGIDLVGEDVASSVRAETNQDFESGRHGRFDEFPAAYFARPLLSHAEEVELGRAIQLGRLAKFDIELGSTDPYLYDFVVQGEHARDKLVESNLRLVFSVAQGLIAGGSLDISDLVQDGTIGLMRAADLFDPDLGLKFSTYATHWIHQAIFRGLDNFGETIRLPVHRLESLRKLRRARHVLSLELGRRPSMKELGEALDWKIEKVAYIQYLASRRVISIDTPVREGSDFTVGDLIESRAPNPEELYIQKEFRLLVREVMEKLPDRQQDVLARRFGLVDGREETLQQIGDVFGVTRERIRQIEVRALQRFSSKAKSAKLERYF